MSQRFIDHTAIVTASSKGLGKATAERLVEEGAAVVISSRNEENLAMAKDEIVEKTGCREERVTPIVCDLSDPGVIKRKMDAAIEELGGLDVLVMNHGEIDSASFEEATIDGFDKTIQSILKSSLVTIKTVLPALKAGGGSIVNVIAVSAQEPPPNHIYANVVRPGIYGLSKTLANELATDGIRVNCVCPRGILTDQVEDRIKTLAEHEGISMEEAVEYRTENVPMGRFGEPSEFADTVAYIASAEASFVTGSVLEVDGGWSRYVH